VVANIGLLRHLFILVDKQLTSSFKLRVLTVIQRCEKSGTGLLKSNAKLNVAALIIR
jgi:hypothetical protein